MSYFILSQCWGARKYSCVVSYVAVHGHSRTRYRNEKLNQGNASEKLLLQLIYKHRGCVFNACFMFRPFPQQTVYLCALKPYDNQKCNIVFVIVLRIKRSYDSVRKIFFSLLTKS